MQKLLLTICLSTLTLLGFSQTNQITGMLQDNTGKAPVVGATVSLLLQKDSSEVNTVVTDASGKFSFDNVANDSFIVTAQSVSYQDLVTFITINNQNRDLGVLKMYIKGKDLSTVTVISKAPPVSNKADTSQYSASQFKVNPDATTEDLIKKMPGITVARDGTVTAQGETVKKVTIDGKDFFGDDASAALKNLPSEVVDKIQVFDRLSDQAQLTGIDDGNSVKAINVVTKTGIRNGQFGRVYAGAGTDERYQAGGNISFFNGDRRLSFVGNFNNVNQQNFGSQDLLGVTSSGGGRGGGRGGFGGGNNFSVGQSAGISNTNAFGVNYNDKWGSKMTVSGSYFYNNSKNTNISKTIGQSLDKTGTWYNDNSTSSYTTINNNNRINMRLEYRLDSNNTIYLIPSLSFQTNDANGFSDGQAFYGLNDSLNTSAAKTTNNRNGYNLRNYLMYRHSFAKKGRTLSFGFNTTFTRNSNENILDAKYRFYDINNVGTDSLPNQFSDNLSTGYTYGGNIAYTEPVFKNAIVQFEYNPSIQKNKADQQTFNFDNGKYSSFDTSLSNRFNNTVTNQSGGISFRYNPTRDNMLMVGMNYQHSRLQSDRTFPSITKVDQTFSNLLPRLMWRKKFGSFGNLRLFYRGGTDFPSVTQLQDVVNISNPLKVSIGNPGLKQAYTNFLSTRYSYANSKTSKSFFANLFAQTTSNYITNATYLVKTDSLIQHNVVLKGGSQLSKPVNVNGYVNLRSLFTYAMPVKFLKSNLNLNAGAGYSKLPGIANYLPAVTHNYTYNVGAGLSSNISEYVDFNISYTANFNNASTKSALTTATNNYVNQEAGLQLNLLNKKGWFIQNDITNQTYSGLSGGLNQSYWLWNAGIGKKFLKKQAGELKLSVFDLLKQNQSITRTVSAINFQDVQTNVLQQYFMLTFTYSLKNFGKGKPSSKPAYGGGMGMPMHGPM
ncbi:MAG: outer membrane beta-barrel protein [Niastella sp.]|nr:outer membrane beta-barrel protein [Niastella sp.]